MASPAFPEPPPSSAPTALPEAERILQKLAEKKEIWVQTSLSDRIRLLQACIETTVAAAEGWVRDAAKAKGLSPELEGEEWTSGPMVTIRNLRMLAESLEKNAQPAPVSVTTRKDGWTVAKVFPAGLMENLMYTGFSGEIWLEPGQALTQGKIYRDKAAGKPGHGGVGLVLAAGNVSSIGPTDALYKLFVDDEVVIMKTNPVNGYLGVHWEKSLAPLVAEGFLAVVNGGAEIGGFLCAHPLVNSVHITGSDSTHDMIVWGRGAEEQKRRKEAHQPVLQKPISSELGCVTPVIVVPGDWSASDIAFQAKHVAGMVGHNGSFNCNAAKVLIVAEGWAHRDAFLKQVKEELSKMPSRRAYYPGAQQRYAAFMERYVQAQPLSASGPEIVPWTFIPGVEAKKGEYALTQEAFCGVLAEVSLPGSTAGDFLPNAVRFANDEVWGTLSCCMIVHPSTEKQFPEVVDAAIAHLRYGGIGINCWAGLIFGSIALSWGAYPGHTLEDIRSGIGSVHNSFLIDNPHHSVMRAPFRIAPYPLWFANHKNLTGLGKALAKMEESPGFFRLLGVLVQAFQG